MLLGNQRTKGPQSIFAFCCSMFQFYKLTFDQAYPIILMYNQRCQPPFDGKAIEHQDSRCNGESH